MEGTREVQRGRGWGAYATHTGVGCDDRHWVAGRLGSGSFVVATVVVVVVATIVAEVGLAINARKVAVEQLMAGYVTR